jgi:hypothetical protein
VVSINAFFESINPQGLAIDSLRVIAWLQSLKNPAFRSPRKLIEKLPGSALLCSANHPEASLIFIL